MNEFVRQLRQNRMYVVQLFCTITGMAICTVAQMFSVFFVLLLSFLMLFFGCGMLYVSTVVIDAETSQYPGKISPWGDEIK